MSSYPARRRRNSMWMGLSVAAAGFGLTWLFLILAVLFWKGLSGVSFAVFTQMTPPPGSAGGLLNAIAGSLMMTVIGVVVGTPLGMLAAPIWPSTAAMQSLPLSFVSSTTSCSAPRRL